MRLQQGLQAEKMADRTIAEVKRQLKAQLKYQGTHRLNINVPNVSVEAFKRITRVQNEGVYTLSVGCDQFLVCPSRHPCIRLPGSIQPHQQHPGSEWHWTDGAAQLATHDGVVPALLFNDPSSITPPLAGRSLFPALGIL